MLAVYEDGTLVERYVWGPLGLVKILKGVNSSPTPYFVVNDHLGYARAVVSAGGTAVAAYDYWPYGKSMRSDVDANCDSRFQFGAKEYDTELGLDLYYFEARFYNPEIGRFVSPDPLRTDWSPYPFAGDNPIVFVDPTGLYWQYSQSTGYLTWYPNGGDPSCVGQGYSGTGEGRNNPAMQYETDTGPISQGEWNIGESYHHSRLGRETMNLLPMHGNDTNRTLMRIHGDDGSYDASAGCIVLDLELRRMIANSGDNLLVVVS